MQRGGLLTTTTRSARRWWIWWLYSHLYTNGYLLVFCLYFSRWNVWQQRWKELLQSVLCQLIIKLLVYLTGVFLQALNDLPVSCHCINLTNSFLCKKVCSTAFSCWLLSVLHPRWDLSLYSVRYIPFLYLHLIYHWSKRLKYEEDMVRKWTTSFCLLICAPCS